MDITSDAVKLTLGPSGKTVCISKPNFNIYTKDGVTVAENINLDGYEKVGNEAVKEAADRTNNSSGDGTTVTSILVQSMVEKGFSSIDSGANPVLLKKGITKAVEFVNEFLNKIAIPVKGYEMIKSVASISANDKEMGTHIANLFHKLGKSGVIEVEEASVPGYEEEYVKGFKWDKPMVSPYMMTDVSRQKAELNDVYILITNKSLSEAAPVAAILNALTLHKKGNKLLTISNDIDGRGLETMVFNNSNVVRKTPQGQQRGSYQTLAVRAPYTSLSQLESLEDMAALTGGTVICEEKGFTLPLKAEEFDISVLGRADKVISNSKVPFIIVQGKGPSDTDVYDDIVVPIDSSNVTKQKLKISANIATYFNSCIHLFSAVESDNFLKDKLNRELHFARKYFDEKEINYTMEKAEQGGSFKKQLIQYAAKINADMIAIVNTREDALLPDFFGSEEQEVIANDAEIPVLITNPTQRFISSSVIGS